MDGSIGSLYCTVCDAGVMLILGGWFPARPSRAP
jgi:hypothetical protein